MKVGILTFHFAHNYGAMLQAYATLTYLCKLGYNAEIIDYRLPIIYRYNYEMFGPIGLYKRYREFNGVLISLAKTILKYWHHRHPQKSWYKFEDFMNKYMIKSPRIYNTQLINKMGYDAIVCGSDQIWNTHITGKLSPEYFGYGFDSNIIKIAYAASSGDAVIGEKDLSILKTYIKSFQAISVREKGLSDFLRNQGVPNINVLDPIFLLRKTDWLKITIPPSAKDYVLTYSFAETDDFFYIAQYVANKMGKKLICFLFTRNNSLPKSIQQVTDGGPREFLGYISNADFIITNSFHGTAFSILFERQFICIPPKAGAERIHSLLSLLSLSSRACNTSGVDKCIQKTVDYKNINGRIEKERNRSYEFLTLNLRK